MAAINEKAMEYTIADTDFAPLKGKVVVLTGGSSGIGRATAELLLSVGALVVNGDVQPSPITHANLSFVHTDVTSWSSLLQLFAHAFATHSRIDHVFANAGIGGRAEYLESVMDETTGDLKEPSTLTYEINLRGMINTSYIGMHYMRTKNSPAGGSVVCTGSGSSYQRFSYTDYCTSKHGVLGFVRGISAQIAGANGAVPIRINGIGPSWTETGLVPKQLLEKAGIIANAQGPEAVARNVALLMADESRQGQFHYSARGRFFEIEETVLRPAAELINSKGSLGDPRAKLEEAAAAK